MAATSLLNVEQLGLRRCFHCRQLFIRFGSFFCQIQEYRFGGGVVQLKLRNEGISKEISTVLRDTLCIK